MRTFEVTLKGGAFGVGSVEFGAQRVDLAELAFEFADASVGSR